MMKLIKLMRSIPAEVNLATILALAALVTKIVVLNRIPAKFVSIYDLGMVVEAILGSIVASYAFYLVTIQVKQQADRRALRPFILKHSQQAVGACTGALAEISNAFGVSLDLNSVTEESLKEAFARMPPNVAGPVIRGQVAPPDGAAPLILGSNWASWLQFFEFHAHRSTESSSRVFSQILFLETSHVKLMVELSDSTFFRQLPMIIAAGVNNPDLSFFAGTFLDFCKKSRDLDSYVKEVLCKEL